MSVRVEGPSHHPAPLPEEQKRTSREHRVEKAVVHALDKASTSTLSLSKICFSVIVEVDNWGALAAWLVLALPTGIISGVFGSVLWGCEKVAEVFSGGRPIALDDTFERVMGYSDATVQANINKGWLGHESAEFLLTLKGQVNELRRDFSSKMKTLENKEKVIRETDQRVWTELKKIDDSEHKDKAKVGKSDIVEYNKEIQSIEEKYARQREVCRKQKAGTIEQVTHEKATLSREFENKLNKLKERYDGYVQEKRLQVEFREYSEKPNPPLSFESFKEGRLEKPWKRLVEEVPGYEKLSLKEYARAPKKYEAIYSLYTIDYKSYKDNQQSQGKPVELWNEWKEKRMP